MPPAVLALLLPIAASWDVREDEEDPAVGILPLIELLRADPGPAEGGAMPNIIAALGVMFPGRGVVGCDAV